jgi:hypothetical protein
MNVMTLICVALLVVVIGSMMIGVGSNNPKWRVISDLSNTILMAILLVFNGMQHNHTWVVICFVFVILDSISLSYNIGKYSDYLKKEKKKKNRISLSDSKEVLNKFVKEIESYGSKRH